MLKSRRGNVTFFAFVEHALHLIFVAAQSWQSRCDGNLTSIGAVLQKEQREIGADAIAFAEDFLDSRSCTLFSPLLNVLRHLLQKRSMPHAIVLHGSSSSGKSFKDVLGLLESS